MPKPEYGLSLHSALRTSYNGGLSIGATFVRSTTGAPMPKPQYGFSSVLCTSHLLPTEVLSIGATFVRSTTESTNAKTAVWF